MSSIINSEVECSKRLANQQKEHKAVVRVTQEDDILTRNRLRELISSIPDTPEDFEKEYKCIR